MVSNSQKVFADWWPPARERSPSEVGREWRWGDRENEDSVYMIQHQDKTVIVGEKSRMVIWTVNELACEQLLHTTLRRFVVWRTHYFSLAAHEGRVECLNVSRIYNLIRLQWKTNLGLCNQRLISDLLIQQASWLTKLDVAWACHHVLYTFHIHTLLPPHPTVYLKGKNFNFLLKV